MKEFIWQHTIVYSWSITKTIYALAICQTYNILTLNFELNVFFFVLINFDGIWSNIELFFIDFCFLNQSMCSVVLKDYFIWNVFIVVQKFKKKKEGKQNKKANWRYISILIICSNIESIEYFFIHLNGNCKLYFNREKVLLTA